MASMSVQLLPLLQGPTRLAVGVLSGAAAADLLLGPTARCYVYRPPYDDEAFKVGRNPAITPTSKPLVAAAAAAGCRRRRSCHCSPAPLPAADERGHHPHLLPAPFVPDQSVYGSQRERELASSKPKRPVGQAALALLSTPSHVALTFGRK